MRLLHPTTLKIASLRDDIPRTVLSHVWSEVFKWKGSGKSHPKMFIDNDRILGTYLGYVYKCATARHCNLDPNKIARLGKEVHDGFERFFVKHNHDYFKYFDRSYLFSDACSLYYKGINIFPDIFGDEWRKYVPVESHKEIMRQLSKNL